MPGKRRLGLSGGGLGGVDNGMAQRGGVKECSRCLENRDWGSWEEVWEGWTVGWLSMRVLGSGAWEIEIGVLEKRIWEE